MSRTLNLYSTSYLSRAAVVALLTFAHPISAYANPDGGTVSAGNATITTSGKTLDVNQTSSKVVIDWRSFDIAPDEVTKFNQPSSSSIALNRVNSSTPSQIFGTLSANGNIVIVNQNGVLFGAGSKVDVNGLVATTANITNENFMKGNMKFDQAGNPNATIENDGTITAKQAGLVGFVAPNVVNNGVITANLGRVQLASGDTATVDFYGDKLMEVAVSDDVKSQLVSNTGTIEANGGKIALTAAAGAKIVNSLINVQGELKAPAVAQKNGEIIIYAEGSNAVANNITANKDQKTGSSAVNVNAQIDVSGKNTGENGGAVKILGDNITVNNTSIDASGDTGGGTVNIGGDFHGAGVIPAALNTSVDKKTIITTSAVTSGNAGNVVVWSDKKTDFDGTINANGGATSGNGGQVEVSGHEKLNLGDDTIVNTLAANGKTGSLLLDPNNIYIETGGTDDGSQDSSTDSYISPAFIASHLATSNLTLDANGKITITDTIVANTGAHTLTLNAGSDINDTADLVLGSNSLVLSSGGTTYLGTVSAASLYASGYFYLNGNLNITGDAYFYGDTRINTNQITAGSIEINGAAYLDSDSNINANSVEFYSTLDGAGGLNITAGNVNFDNNVGSGSALGHLTVNASNSTTISGDISTSGGGQEYTGQVYLTASYNIEDYGGGNLTFHDRLDDAYANQDTVWLSGGEVDLYSVGRGNPFYQINIQSSSGTYLHNAYYTSAAGGITFSGPVYIDGSVAMYTSGGGNITFYDNIDGANSGTDSLELDAYNANVYLYSVGGSNALHDLSIRGNANLEGGYINTHGGGVEFNNQVTLQGDTYIADDNGGDINFESTIDGGSQLTVNTGGRVHFANDIGDNNEVGTLDITAGNGILIDSGSISVNNIYFQSPVVVDNNLSISNGNQYDFFSTVDDSADGSHSLSINSNAIAFSGNIGSIHPFNSLQASANSLYFYNSNITTKGGGQSYYGSIWVDNSNVLITDTAGGAITFNASVDDASSNQNNLTVNTSGDIYFNYGEGNNSPLGSLTAVTSGGGIYLGNNVTTDGGLTLTAPNLYIQNNLNIVDNEGANLSFGTIDSSNSNYDLSISTSGDINLNGSVGNSTAFNSLTFNAANININALTDYQGYVSANSGITFNGAVNLGNNEDISNGGNNLTFNSTIDGPYNLTIYNSNGGVYLNGAIGSNTPLHQLDVIANNNAIYLNAGTVTTGGSNNYAEFESPVVLGTDTTITSGATVFDNYVDGDYNFTLHGVTSFYGNVGSNVPLESFHAYDEVDFYNIALYSNGDITFDGEAYLGSGSAYISSGGSVTYNSNISGYYGIETHASGSVTYNGDVDTSADFVTVAPSIYINTGSLSAGGNLLLEGATTFSQDLTASGGNYVDFDGPLDGAHNLTTISPITIFELTGGTTPLTSIYSNSPVTYVDDNITATGNIEFVGQTNFDNGSGSTPNVTSSSGDIILDGAVILTLSNGAFTSTTGNVTFNSTIDDDSSAGNNYGLTVNAAQTATFSDSIGGTNYLNSLNVNAGTINIDSSYVNTAYAIDFNGPVNLPYSVNMNSQYGDISFESTLDGPGDLYISAGSNNGGNNSIYFHDTVGGSTPLHSIDVNEGTVQAYADITTAGGSSNFEALNLNNDINIADTSGGTFYFWTINGGALQVTTTGQVNYNGDISVSNLTTNASSIVLNNTQTTASGDIEFNGPVSLYQTGSSLSINGQNITFESTIDGNDFLAITAAGALTLNGDAGANNSFNGFNITGNGGIYLNGSIYDNNVGSNNITINSPLIIGANVSINEYGNGYTTINQINSASAGNYDLTITNVSGTTTLNGDIGDNAPLHSLYVSGSTNLNAGNYTTSGGGIEFNGPVTIYGSPTTIQDSNGGNITFDSTLDGTNGSENLSITTTGLTTLGDIGDTTAINALTVNGPVTLNGNITTTGGSQTFNGAVSIGNNITDTDTSGGQIAFNSTLDDTSAGSHTFTINTSGVVIFGDNVGSASPLSSLDVTGNNGISLNGDVTATSYVGFDTPLYLQKDANISADISSGEVEFNLVNDSTADTHNLTVNAGDVYFNGQVGTIAPLHSITTNSNGYGTEITTSFVTGTGGVTINGTALPYDGSDIVSGGDIIFNGNIVAGNNSEADLTVSTPGSIYFNGDIGDDNNIYAIIAEGDTGIYLGGNVAAGSDITFTGPVNLSTAVSINSNADVTFNNTIDGLQPLSILTPGTVNFNDNLGATTPLGYLYVSGGTGVNINSSSITAQNDIQFGSGITLGHDLSILSFSSGIITFSGTVDGAHALSTAGEFTTFGGAVGGNTALSSLNVSSSQIYLGDNITADGDIGFGGDNVTLNNSSNIISNNGAVTIDNAIDDSSAGTHVLYVAAHGIATLNGDIGSNTALDRLIVAGSEIDLGGSVTANSAEFIDPVILTAGSNITTTSTNFDSTVDGGYDLQVNGPVNFYGALGDTTPLNSLLVSGSAIGIYSDVKATGNIEFDNAVTLDGDSTIASSGGNITFEHGIDGGQSLTINAAGGALFGDAIGGSTSLNAVSITTGGELTLPNIVANSVFAQTTGTNSDIVIQSGETINSSGSDGITLVAGRNFINYEGSDALQANNGGRWLIYSTNATDTQLNGLTNDFNRYSCTYGGACPDFSSETGNGALYSFTPMLNVTADAKTVTYGDAAPTYTYTISSGDYLGSDASNDSITSTGSTYGSLYAQGSNAGSYNITGNSGSLVSALGYGFTYNTLTNGLTVNKKNITASFNADLTKTYGDANPTITYNNLTFTNLYSGDSASVFTNITPNFGGIDATTNAGTYNGAVSAVIGSTTNYNVTNTPTANLVIGKATLLVTPDSFAITPNSILPTLTGSVTGFKNNQTIADLTTAPTYSTAATSASPNGTYNINAGGAASNNYMFNYVLGHLTIAPIPVSQAFVLPSTVVKTFQTPVANMTNTMPFTQTNATQTTSTNNSNASNSGSSAGDSSTSDSKDINTTYEQSSTQPLQTLHGLLQVDPDLAAQLDIDIN